MTPEGKFSEMKDMQSSKTLCLYNTFPHFHTFRVHGILPLEKNDNISAMAAVISPNSDFLRSYFPSYPLYSVVTLPLDSFTLLFFAFSYLVCHLSFIIVGKKRDSPECSSKLKKGGQQGATGSSQTHLCVFGTA